jgi:outer membrane protein assembly factor BamB
VVIVADADPETWGPNGLVDKTRLRGRVWGIDPATGTPIWKKTVGTFSAFVATDGWLVVAASSSGQNNGEAAAFEAQTGRELWRIPAGVSSPPAVRDGVVLLPSSELSALEANTGRRLWSREPIRGGTFSFPAIVGDVAVATSNTGTAELTAMAGHTPGSLIAYAEVGDSRGEWFERNGEIWGLVRGGLVRVESSPSGWRYVVVLIPQGAIDSASPAPQGIAFSTGIGSAPETVALLEP